MANIHLDIGGAANHDNQNVINSPFATGEKIAEGAVIDDSGAVVPGVSVTMPVIFSGDATGIAVLDVEVNDATESTQFRLGNDRVASVVVNDLPAGQYRVTVYSNRGSDVDARADVSVNGQAVQQINGRSSLTFAERSTQFIETITAGEALTIAIAGINDASSEQARVNWIYIEELSAAGPTITAVSSPAGVDILQLNGALTIDLNDAVGVTSVTATGIALSNVNIVDADTVTALVGLGVAANIGDTIDIVVNNGSVSNAYAVTVAPPAGFSAVTLTVDYADINTDSWFSGESAFSSLVTGDVLVYDNLGGVLTIAGDLLETFDPELTVSTSVDYYFLDASDSYRADASIKTVTYTASGADRIPGQFDVGADVSDASPGDEIIRLVTITEIDPGETIGVIPVDAADISLDGVTYSTSLDVVLNDVVRVRVIAGPHDAVVTGGLSTIGPVANRVIDTFSVTTVPAPPEAPTMPADTTVNIVEGNTQAGTFVATAGSSPITYTLGGADAGNFSIGSSTGLLSLNTLADYETKASYAVSVIATNSEGSDTQNITVNVTNVIEVVITDAGDTTLAFSYGSGGLAHDDPALVAYLASFINATGNTLSANPDPLPAGVITLTHSAPDAVDVVSQLTVAEALPVEDDAIIADFRVYPGISVNTRRTLFPENTHVAELDNTRFAVAGTPINDATVTVVLTSAGVELQGQVWPTSLLPVDGEAGKYRAVLSHQIDLNSVSNGRVQAEVTIVKEASQAKYSYALQVTTRSS